MTEAVLLAVKKIGNALADETAKRLVAKLSEKVSNLIDLDDKIDHIRKQLQTMNNVIEQIGTTYLTDKTVKGWIEEVRKVAYRVEDVMDKYSYHCLQMVEERFLKKYLIKGTHYVVVFSQIADEVVKIEKGIDQVIKLKEQWLQPSQLAHDPYTEMERQRSQDSFPELVTDEDLIGIEDNRRMLTEWLYSDEIDSKVITVSGMGGLGKTTLVTNVYEREKLKFQARAWMVVSQTYTVDDLLRKLLRKVGYTEQKGSCNIDRMDAYDLKEEIKRMLKDRKCLLVLDDVWNQEVYFQIRDAFQSSHGSRIIITTRSNHVAALAPSARCLDIKPLGDAHAFELFCRRVFYSKRNHECPSDLKKIATSVVDRCQGLPLAIVTMGSFLSSRPPTQYIWEQICNQFRTELSRSNHVRAVLNLSYHDLSGDLRNCFLYCSLFPEDYQMSRENLVRLWVAEGFVLSKENSTPEEVAERNLMELIHRNLLIVKETDELGRVSSCMMHDIVRDLALCIAREERFVSANDYAAMTKMDRDVRRLSSCGWKENSAPKVKLPRLRTLVSLGSISSTPAMLSSILSESSYLTVLELQDSAITEVPELIGNLFNLRYIGLRRTMVKSLPDSVENLSNLETLDIKQTNIEKLPRGIAKIKKLQHLLADRYVDEKQSKFLYFVGIQAPKDLSKMQELQTLETVQANKDLAEQLKRMTRLRSVWIDNISSTDCANIFATLSNMPLLSSLLLSARDENEALCFETLKPMSKHLHRLIIRGGIKGTLKCPVFRGHAANLKYLALSSCHFGEDPLGMLASHLPNLTYLKLNSVHSAAILVLPANSFPHLKTLVLKQMPDVNEIKIMGGALPSIDALYVVSLSKLDKVPRGIEYLRSLKSLWLLGLHKDFRTQWDKNGMHQKMMHVPEVRV
ncbi:disease resistance protein RPM1-like [Lolium rigidum]|uniref:disease resistance protein RPM1-like n=1 Tax=Lolium rigidum TaxID=89674 RepID=UPI001F5DA1BD|nr:disease resistance protein RPM1-like [Lolium rigidum]